MLWSMTSWSSSTSYLAPSSKNILGDVFFYDSVQTLFQTCYSNKLFFNSSHYLAERESESCDV